MNAISTVLWVLTIVASCAAVAVAVLAARPGRHWLVVLCGVPVVGVLVAGIATAPPHPAIVIVLGIAIALLGVIAGNPAVTLILTTATREDTRAGAHGGILVRDATAPAPAQREVLRGGATIGYLERVALIGSVVAGQSAAVAILVAVKGLGRFSELVDEQARERFIIGTLASLIWSGLCAATILALAS